MLITCIMIFFSLLYFQNINSAFFCVALLLCCVASFNEIYIHTKGVSEREMYTQYRYIYTNGKDRSLLPVLQKNKKKERKKI